MLEAFFTPISEASAHRNSPPTQQTIHFLSDTTEPDVKSKHYLQNHAKFLISHPEWMIELQGHTDERNSREYNIVISEMMSKSIANYLILLGVETQRISTIGFGEELPACKKHSHRCWQTNRRVHIVYKPFFLYCCQKNVR